MKNIQCSYKYGRFHKTNFPEVHGINLHHPHPLTVSFNEANDEWGVTDSCFMLYYKILYSFILVIKCKGSWERQYHVNVYGNCHRSWHFSSKCWRLISSQKEMQITNTVVGFYTARREWLQKTDLSHDDAFQRFVRVREHYKRNKKFPAECSLSGNVEINIYNNITDAAITNDAVVLEGLRCFNCFLPQKNVC